MADNPSQERIVLCMKWGTLFPASHVNAMFNAVRNNLSLPFSFVCLTEDPVGLDPDILHFPIPDLELPNEKIYSGAWPKLSLYQKDLYGLKGTALFIDLDDLILGSLDPFFEMQGEFISIAGGVGWKRGSDNPNPRLSTSVFRFNIGEQSQIVEKFLADPQWHFDNFQHEQQVVEAYCHGWSTWPKDWVISFKKHLRRPPLIDRLIPPRTPPEGTLVLGFHGDPRPIELAKPGNHRWAKFPRYGKGPVPWVRQYWLDNGYEDP